MVYTSGGGTEEPRRRFLRHPSISDLHRLQVIRITLLDYSCTTLGGGARSRACARPPCRERAGRQGRRAFGPRFTRAPRGICNCRIGCRSAASPFRTRTVDRARRTRSATAGGLWRGAPASRAPAGKLAGWYHGDWAALDSNQRLPPCEDGPESQDFREITTYVSQRYQESQGFPG